MKLLKRILSIIVIAGLTTFYVSCKKPSDKKTDEEIQFGKLTQVWAISSANNDGTNRTADFPSLKLTLSGSFAEGGTYNYSFTGTRPNPSPWPVSGFWKFGPNPKTEIIRDPASKNANGEINMTYTVTDTGLTVSFNVPAGSSGWAGGTSRVRTVSGDWTFEFTKQ
jgi:hypothetical protein